MGRAKRGRPPKVKVEQVEQEEVVEETTPPPPPEETASNNGTGDIAPLVDRESLIKRRYRTGIVSTSLGRSYEIRSIDPKTLLLTRGTAFLPAFNEFIESADPVRQQELLADPEIQDFIRLVCCEAITTLNFVDKSIDDCTEEETPIEAIDVDERIEIFSAVMELCATEDEREIWKFLPPSVPDEPISEAEPS